MPDATPSSVSPEFTRFCQIIFDALNQALPRGVAPLVPAPDRPLRVKAHVRALSPLQRLVRSAIVSGLMLRDERGRFTGLDPRLSAKLALLKRKLIISKKLTRSEVRKLQRETFGLLAQIQP